MWEKVGDWLVDPDGLTPHGFCLLWQPGLIWTQVFADVAIGLAYCAMSLALASFAQRRRDLVFRPLFRLFAAFILLCGASHWLDAATMWVPAYGLQTVVKLATGVVSVVTAIVLWRLLPQAMAMPSPTQLHDTTQALRRSEAFLERISTVAGVGGWELDLTTNAISWSAETYRIHGVPPDHCPTLDAAIDFYAPEARPVIRAAVARATATGEPWDLELPFIRANGDRIWVRAAGSIDFVDGQPVRAIGAFQDVTARVDTRRALQEANDRATLATESAGIGVWERTIATGEMIWDACMFRIYGRVQGVDMPSLAMWQSHVHPEDRAGIDSAVQATIDDGARYATEYRILRSDGSMRHIRSFAHVGRDPDGRIVKMVGVNWDITEARLLAAELERQTMRLTESEAKFRRLAENANDTISWVAADGSRQYVSPAALHIFGMSAEQLMASNMLDFFHPDDRNAAIAMQTGLLDGTKEHDSGTFRVRHLTRGDIWIELNARSLRNHNNQSGGYVSVMRDVTDRVRIEQELRAANGELDRLARHFSKARIVAEQASRTKTRFLAGMSHELRTPLNGILGYAQLLHMDGGLTETQSARVAAMMDAGTHLLEMIHCVLDLSQIETEGTECQMATVDLLSVGKACLGLLRPAADAKQLALDLAIAADVPASIVTDPTRLRQVLLNFLGNAVKFTTSGSVSLRMTLPPAGGWLRVEVADTGPGIPNDQRHRLFQAFERLVTDAAAQIEGAGLGLSLSAQLARLMGGRLGHHDNPGGGSVFWLEVPLQADATANAVLPAQAMTKPVVSARDDASVNARAGVRVNKDGGSDEVRSPLAPHTTAAIASSPAAGARLLLVDDVAMNRDIAASFLTSAGYAVTCVEDGETAVAAAADNDFSAVLMDVRMPGIDGLEATRRIRALPGPRALVPVVALTAQVFTEQIAACRAAGMDTHVAKPFTLESLLNAVTQALDAARSRLPPEVAVSQVANAMLEASADPGSGLLTLNLDTLEQIAALLASPTKVVTHFRELIERTEVLRRALRAHNPFTEAQALALAETAHALGGSAGMLGFERLASEATRFEQMALQGPSQAAGMVDAFDAVLATALLEMRPRSVVPKSVPAMLHH